MADKYQIFKCYLQNTKHHIAMNHDSQCLITNPHFQKWAKYTESTKTNHF